MRMNQESGSPGEYYSSNLYCKRYPRKTRCIIKSGNIFCSRMCHIRMQNGPRTSVSVSGKWSCIFCESPSPFANNCILWFIKVFSNFSILTSCILYVFSLFRSLRRRRKKISRCYLVLRTRWIALHWGLYVIFILKIEKEIYILKIKV